MSSVSFFFLLHPASNLFGPPSASLLADVPRPCQVTMASLPTMRSMSASPDPSARGGRSPPGAQTIGLPCGGIVAGEPAQRLDRGDRVRAGATPGVQGRIRRLARQPPPGARLRAAAIASSASAWSASHHACSFSSARGVEQPGLVVPQCRARPRRPGSTTCRRRRNFEELEHAGDRSSCPASRRSSPARRRYSSAVGSCRQRGTSSPALGVAKRRKGKLANQRGRQHDHVVLQGRRLVDEARFDDLEPVPDVEPEGAVPRSGPHHCARRRGAVRG